MITDSGAQVIFSSILPVEGRNFGRNRQAESINTWIHDCCHHQKVGGFDNGMSGLCSTRHVGTRWDSPFSGGEESLCSETSRAHWQSFKLYVSLCGGEEQYQACPGKLWDEMLGQRGLGASKSPLPLTLKCIGHTRAHSQSYGDDAGIPEVIEANRETPEKYHSSMKVTQTTAQLRSLYTNVLSMGNRQVELEATCC